MVNLLTTFAFLYLFMLPSATLAAPAVVLTQYGDGPIQDAHVEARRGEPVTLYAAVRRRGVWYADAPSIRVKRRRISPRPLADLGAVEITWSTVEPRQHHVETRSPNFGNPAYSNSVLFGPKHGKWLGYDTLEYIQTPLPQRGGQLRVDRAQPTDPRLAVHQGLGTIRFAVQVESAAGTFTSPDAQSVGRGGVRDSVRRLSFRRGDDAVGWLTGFFNVPNVFGSAGTGRRHQTELHQGADCADVLVGAFRKAGVRMPYTSVAGLYRFARPVTEKLLLTPEGIYEIGEDGQPGAPARLRFGEDVRPGDLVTIDYAMLLVTRRSWDHIGMIGDDRGEQGRWDPADGLLHMGYLYGLEHTPLRDQGRAVIQVIRLRPDLLRRARRLERAG